MEAKCKICKREWNISIYQNKHNYICPHCEFRVRSKKGKMLERNRNRYA